MSATICPTRARIDQEREAFDRHLALRNEQHDDHVWMRTLHIYFLLAARGAAAIDLQPLTQPRPN